MSSFFAELRRRNVFKVGVAYAIVAWLLIQITSTVAPALNLPGWTLTFIIYLVIIGFPLTLIITWAFELTPEGVKPTRAVALAPAVAQAKSQRMNYIILGLLTLAVTFLLVDNYVLVDKPGTTTVSSVAGPAATTSGEMDSTTQNAASSTSISSTPPLVWRASLDLGETQPLGSSFLGAFINLSRDGRHLVYAAQIAGTRRLYYRAMDQLTARPIPGTEGAIDVFFSPDGKWVVYEDNPNLNKLAVVGGPPQVLTRIMDYPRGACWSDDDVVYFTLNGKLQRISANGGKPEPVNIQSEYKDWFHAWPSDLPGGSHLLLTVQNNPLNARDGHTILLSPSTGKTELLIRNGFNARYVPTGHIVFMRSGSLWAVPFDVQQLKTTGPEIPVVNGIQTSGGLGQAVYAFSNAGYLIYLPGEDVQSQNMDVPRRLVWVDRQGNETLVGAKANNYLIPHLSPDGQQVAISAGILGVSTDIWVYDFTRDTLSKRTFSGNAVDALWTPDGEYLVYTFNPNYQGLARIKADGAGQPELLLDAPRIIAPTSFTPDGSQLIYTTVSTEPVGIHVFSMNTDHTDQLLLTGNNEMLAILSPDGKWMAYASSETGQSEVYVRPYPDIDNGKWQISNNGGGEPYWRKDGKELFYRGLETRASIMAVPIETGDGFQAGAPIKLFQGDFYINESAGINYDVTADGQRFLMMKLAENTNEGSQVSTRKTSLVVVNNWFGELNRLAPHGN